MHLHNLVLSEIWLMQHKDKTVDNSTGAEISMLSCLMYYDDGYVVASNS